MRYRVEVKITKFIDVDSKGEAKLVARVFKHEPGAHKVSIISPEQNYLYTEWDVINGKGWEQDYGLGHPRQGWE
jgi:hypothetical protein